MKKIFLVSSVGIIIFLIFIFVEVYLFLNIIPTQEKKEKVIQISFGTPFRKIAKQLKEEAIITHEVKFYFLSRFQGNLNQIKAGEYLLYTNMKPLEVLDTLVSGRTYLYRATIPEGYNMYEIAKILSSIPLVSEQEFLSKAQDPFLLRDLNIDGPSVEGYLFPETYFFSKPVTSEMIIRTMVKRFNENYTDEIQFKAQKLGLTRKKVVILASIIEKETGLAEERRLISAVFHNRLRINMKLQSDPTVIYGIKNFNGNLTKKHLLTPSPYNTYTLYGLPYGPVANPGKETLEATVNPASANYLYFVSRNDGSHIFSTTYKDHLKAVQQYQPRIKSKTRVTK